MVKSQGTSSRGASTRGSSTRGGTSTGGRGRGGGGGRGRGGVGASSGAEAEGSAAGAAGGSSGARGRRSAGGAETRLEETDKEDSPAPPPARLRPLDKQKKRKRVDTEAGSEDESDESDVSKAKRKGKKSGSPTKVSLLQHTPSAAAAFRAFEAGEGMIEGVTPSAAATALSARMIGISDRRLQDQQRSNNIAHNGNGLRLTQMRMDFAYIKATTVPSDPVAAAEFEETMAEIQQEITRLARVHAACAEPQVNDDAVEDEDAE